MAKFIPYFHVTKPRISLMVNFVAISSLIIAGGYGRFDTIVILLISGFLSVAGASAFNAYFDRDLDSMMGRTRKRPIPSGTIMPAKKVLVMASILSFASIMLSWTLINPLTAFFIGLGIFTYVGVYTLWLKRRHPSNIVLGGFAGSCAALAGWSSVANLTIVPLLIALVVFLWTPSHFWALALKIKDEYAKAKIPMLPSLVSAKRASITILLNTLILVTSSVLLFFIGGQGFTYISIALLGGSLMIWANIKLVRDPSKRNAWTAYKISSPYLAIFFMALMLDLILRPYLF